MEKNKNIFIFLLVFFLLPTNLSTQHNKKKANTQSKTPIKSEQIQTKLLRISELIEKQEPLTASLWIKDLYPEVIIDKKREYYKLLSERLLSGDLLQMPFLWDNLEDKAGCTLLITVNNSSLKPLLITYLADQNQLFQKYFKKTEKFLEKIKFRDKYGAIPDLISPLYIVNLINKTEVKSFSIVISGINDEKKLKYFTLFLHNIFKNYYNSRIKKIAKIIFNTRDMNEFSLQSGVFFHTMNRTASYFGEVLTASKDDSQAIVTIETSLDKYFPVIEEIRSNTAAVYTSTIFQDNKILTKRQEKSVYLYYLTFLINKMRVNPLSPTKLPYLIQFNRIITKNGVKLNLNNSKIELDMEVLRKIISGLHGSMKTIEKAADPEQFSVFIDSYSELPGWLKKITADLENLNSEEI
jgi:hypothetical protein